ncbi:MAG TPA: protease inhibitor I42 family protein [Burkholderiales bacterium]|jgi:predicted secreted protein
MLILRHARRYWTKVPYLLIVASLAGCAGGLSQAPGTPPIPALMVAEGDAGRAVSVERGRKVTLRLEANRSAGYRWFLASSGDALEPLGEPFYAAEKTAAGAPGAEYWSFMARHPGRQELRFEYRRPWESGTPAAKGLSYTIDVR